MNLNTRPCSFHPVLGAEDALTGAGGGASQRKTRQPAPGPRAKVRWSPSWPGGGWAVSGGCSAQSCWGQRGISEALQRPPSHQSPSWAFLCLERCCCCCCCSFSSFPSRPFPSSASPLPARYLLLYSLLLIPEQAFPPILGGLSRCVYSVLGSRTHYLLRSRYGHSAPSFSVTSGLLFLSVGFGLQQQGLLPKSLHLGGGGGSSRVFQ